MLAAAKMDDSLANGEKKWNCPTAPIITTVLEDVRKRTYLNE